MLSDQISIVLSAPLPFALGSFAVVIPICALIWWAMQRAYRKNIDAKQSMYEQAAQ